MSRRKAAAAKSARRTGPTGPSEKLVDKADGQWWVRALTGSSSTKDYRCPGCDQLIKPATPHVVVWPEQKALLSANAVDERRHWHSSCWGRKH